jgi:hypothetical protein
VHKVTDAAPHPHGTVISTLLFLKLSKYWAGKQTILNYMVASILLTLSAINFFLDAIVIDYFRSDFQQLYRHSTEQ